jgi:hypothetical protein
LETGKLIYHWGADRQGKPRLLSSITMTFGFKGTSSSRRNESEFPHIVEMALPRDGFDHRLRRQMEEFHSSQKIKARFGRRTRYGNQEYCRWCFADPTCADAFRELFGGERLTIAKTPMEPAPISRR